MLANKLKFATLFSKKAQNSLKPSELRVWGRPIPHLYVYASHVEKIKLRGDIHITLARKGGGGVPGLLTDANRGGGGV